MDDASDPSLFDLFISYSNKDNVIPPGEREGWVQVFVRRIQELALGYTQNYLTTTDDADPGFDEQYRTFFDKESIAAGHDWESRLLSAVSHTRVLLACLSPHYWESKWCRREWETYLDNEAARGLAHMEGGITPIYIATEPGSRTEDVIAAAPDWARRLLETRQVRLLPFENAGLDALARLKALENDPVTVKALDNIATRIGVQIKHARRAEGRMKGNLASGTPTFVGRTAELADLERLLFGGGALGVITALRGLGGQGKTALALRYGHNLRSRYTGGCWQIPAEGATELVPLLARLREPLGLPAVATDTDSDTARRVLADLHHRAHHPDFRRGTGDYPAALLLLDNVDHPALLGQTQRNALHQAMAAAGLPGDPGWLHLLATTRLEPQELSFLPPENIVPVDALPLAEALTLWQRILAKPGHPLPPEELAAAERIITLLERHTLAVEVAARHIRRSIGESARTYLIRLERALATPGQAAATLSHQQTPLRDGHLHPLANSLATALRFTFEHLAAEPEGAAALTALHYAAHFPPEAVPLPWLRTLAGQHHPALLAPPEAPGLPTAWDRAELRLTESLRLLTHADGDAPEIARLHRLAGDFLRQAALQSGHDPTRSTEVEAFIYRRCALAESQHTLRLQAWERAVLLSDLPVRMARPECSPEMAKTGGFLGQILTAYADLATARRLTAAAHELQRRLAASDPDNAGWQRDLFVSLIKLGDLAVAQGDLAAAWRSFTESKAIAQRLAASDPDNAGWQRDLSASLMRLGNHAVAQGDLAAALRPFTECHAILQRLAASDPDNAGWQRDLAQSHCWVGMVQQQIGELGKAKNSFTAYRDTMQRLADSDPDNAGWQRDLWVSNGKLGDLQQAQGNLPEALRLWTVANGITRRLADSDPANAGWQRDLSVSLNQLGDLAVAQGDLAAALRSFTESKAIRQRLADSDPDHAGWQRDLWVSYWRLADLSEKNGQAAEAQNPGGRPTGCSRA